MNGHLATSARLFLKHCCIQGVDLVGRAADSVRSSLVRLVTVGKYRSAPGALSGLKFDFKPHIRRQVKFTPPRGEYPARAAIAARLGGRTEQAALGTLGLGLQALFPRWSRGFPFGHYPGAAFTMTGSCELCAR